MTSHQGSSGHATGGARHHWVAQRASAIALVPLMVWFVFTVVHLAGADHASAVQHFRSPWRVTVMTLFIGIVFYHGYLGIQVILEDYITDKRWQRGLLFAAGAVAVLFGAIGIISVIRIGI